MPARAAPLGIRESSRQRGICQVSCSVRENIGEIAALEMAKIILDAFPRLTVLGSGELIVRIDDPAYVSGGIQSEGWYMIPVSIPYYIIK